MKNGVIQRKLAVLDRQVARLSGRIADITFDQFEEDWVLRAVSERVIQVAAEIMIDIAERVIALEGAGPVASAAEAIDRLASLGVLRQAEPYRSIVRLRNLIVHQYEEVDPRILFEIAHGRLDDFRGFRDEIDRWVVL